MSKDGGEMICLMMNVKESLVARSRARIKMVNRETRLNVDDYKRIREAKKICRIK
jgi:hypothetical protein